MLARIPRRVVGAVALSAALFGAACGTPFVRGTSAAHIKQLPKDEIVGSYLGLTPTREDISGSLSNQQANAYVSAVGLYALRHNDLLEATLQVSKLSDKAKPKDPKFQQQVAAQIGGTAVQQYVVGGHPVFRSSSRKQSLAAWFNGDYFYVLSVRDTYKYPRGLLRVLLTQVNP